MKTKLAAFISLIGHPLLTIPLVATFLLFRFQAFEQALFAAALLIGGIILPLAIKMFLNARRGIYTNFDVSNQGQRQTWYVSALLLLLFATIVLLATGQPRTLCLSVLFSLLLLLVSQLVNYYIKSSLHVSLNLFLSFLLLPVIPWMGAAFIAFTLLIAWSRIILQRHTVPEVIAGSVIGSLVGLAAFFFI